MKRKIKKSKTQKQLSSSSSPPRYRRLNLHLQTKPFNASTFISPPICFLCFHSFFFILVSSSVLLFSFVFGWVLELLRASIFILFFAILVWVLFLWLVWFFMVLFLEQATITTATLTKKLSEKLRRR